MKEKVKKVLRSLIFISVGVFLFWLVYRKTDFREIFRVLGQGKLAWLLLSMSLGLLSHFLRSVRWKLLIKPLGYNPRTSTLFYSVMIMYLTNMAVPRSGEIVRCATVSKYEKIPFSSLLGTVVTERIIDFIMLFLLLAIVVLTQFEYLTRFLDQNPQIAETLTKFWHSTPLIIGILTVFTVILILMYVYRHKLKNSKLFGKVYALIVQFWQGLKTVASLDRKFLFIFYTVAIWGLYFIMIYVAFFAFDFTSHLSLLAGLTVFVLASFGMVFPSPGGMGSWHFMAIEALKLYGIPADPYGRTFAFAAHESQMLMLLVAGFFSLFAISLIKNKTTIKPQENE